MNKFITNFPAAGVSELNGLTGAVTLAAGTNITLTPSGNTITIASTGEGTGLTSAHILVGNVSNLATDVAMSGDIAINNTGVTSYSGTVPLNKGGSGQVTANASLNAFLPDQTSNSGKFLTTNGTNSSWAPVTVTPSTSEICVGTITGQGSTNHAVLIFGAIIRNNGGSDITYVTNATNGDTFTVNTTGVYSITLSSTDPNVNNSQIGITRNASGADLTGTNLYAVTPGVLLIGTNLGALDDTFLGSCSVTLPLTAGDVIRFQGGNTTTPGQYPGGNKPYEIANICRVA